MKYTCKECRYYIHVVNPYCLSLKRNTSGNAESCENFRPSCFMDYGRDKRFRLGQMDCDRCEFENECYDKTPSRLLEKRGLVKKT